MLSRRQFLHRAPAAALLAQSQLSASRLASVGVQLYTVRGVLPKQPAETLKAIRDIGYREIEATYAGLDGIWPAVADSGLKPVSIHLDNTLMNAGKEDDLARALDQVKKWGFAYAVFPYLPPAERGGLEKIRALCDKLNRAGEKCRALGIRFCYHNHAFEFEPMEGTTGFRVMVDRLDKNLCGFELDCFWVSVAGHDPAALLRELSGRVPLVHLKDKQAGTPVLFKESVDRAAFKEVGSGSLDWKAILRAAASAKVEHYFVEQDQTPGDPIESLRKSFGFVSTSDY
jgi:sugar phosphate isomerase/epimerase